MFKAEFNSFAHFDCGETLWVRLVDAGSNQAREINARRKKRTSTRTNQKNGVKPPKKKSSFTKKEKYANGEVIFLNFFNSLVQQVQDNVDVIMAYSSSNSHTDLKVEPIVEGETMRIVSY